MKLKGIIKQINMNFYLILIYMKKKKKIVITEIYGHLCLLTN